MKKTFKALEVTQNDWKFYVFSIKSDMLYRIAYVSRRETDKKEGYQRNLSLKRAKEINDYVFRLKGIIPNNIILNFDVDLNYDASKQTISFDVKDDIAWVIDGQHRLFGLSLSDKAIDVVVVAFEKLDIPNQAKVFRVINSTQKGVNASLIYDLIDLVKDASFLEERAHELVKKLNDDPESPWYQQIKMLGTGKGLITQSAFVDNLKLLLDEGKRASLHIYTEEEQYGILKNYFSAIKFLFPEDWGNANSLLTKTMGFYSLMLLLPTVLQLCLSATSDFKVNTIIGILEPIKDYDFSSKGLLKGVSGKAGVERIVSELNVLLKAARKAKPTGRIKL
ncbi:MAG: DGQHR domain-containing protein [Nitrospirae bacterium]|nr:DGQHR domain-containing protein [Nitrospirota bacterium]MCL5422944.1 DGQHR domain-containing protein [Nitrospirota bacterium]